MARPDLDLEWDRPLEHRVGAEDRLCGIDVFHEFPWRDVFRDERTQFKNGKSLATLVKSKCPAGKTPALLLTLRDGVRQGIRQTAHYFIFVVNLPEYRTAEGNTALSYVASHLGLDVTDLDQLQQVADAANPEVVRAFVGSSIDLEHISEWVADRPDRVEQLRELIDESSDASSLRDALDAAAGLSELDEEDVTALSEFLRLAAAHNFGDAFGDPRVVERIYDTSPDAFRNAIRSDAAADDVIALRHRKAVIDQFRLLLHDPEAFKADQARIGRGREAVWQHFLEDNPWILGVGLSGQLFTSWDPERLEQVVAGFSVGGPGKRADALLRTAGRIRSLVFAEIKHHETALLDGKPYRPGCWPPSTELSGGVTQAQQTVAKAIDNISNRLPDVDDDGAETGEATWLIRPRSFLIVGHLDELRGTSGVNAAKFQSFELYRRNLYEPEIITFDELLARAEWHIELAEQEE